MGRNGHRWDRLAVVIGGVTFTQGEGPEADPFDASERIKALDLGSLSGMIERLHQSCR